MYNEAAHIEEFVSDLASQDFAGEYEVLVADGRSSDDSVARLRAACSAAGLTLTVVDNPDRWVSHGLNACIRATSANLIVRMDCHTRYPPQHLRLSALAAEETGAWIVGGLTLPVGRTTIERAVALAMSSPFGGVHWTRHAASRTRVEVDTVHCGAYRPEAFRRAGLFDEALPRNQDDDLAFRIRAAGGTVVLDPAIRSHYIPRGSLRGVLRQYYEYGYWKVAVTRKHGRIISGRSLAPPAFVGTLALLALVSPGVRVARRWLVGELALYASLATGFAIAAARSQGESARLVPRVAAVFPTFHFAYGLGTAVGVLRRAGADRRA
jgi:GT2 family glycosyltransferase